MIFIIYESYKNSLNINSHENILSNLILISRQITDPRFFKKKKIQQNE